VDKKLIAFDVEGIILPKATYLLKLFIENKPGKILNLLSIGLQDYIGLVSLETAIKNIFQYLKGLQEEILVSTIKEIELKPGVAQLFNDLRLKEYTLALITSGIPQQALDYLREILPVDYAVGPKVLCSDGKMSGEVKGTVIDEGGKKDALKSIIEQNSLSEYRIISIADDRNNISLFQMSDLSIGYRPDFFITLYSDRITKGNLRGLLPLIDGSEPEKRGLKPSTILRKIVHSSGILIPLFLTKHIDPHIVAALLIFLQLFTSYQKYGGILEEIYH
jgi:phosphoserine phosphatase